MEKAERDAILNFIGKHQVLLLNPSFDDESYRGVKNHFFKSQSNKKFIPTDQEILRELLISVIKSRKLTEILSLEKVIESSGFAKHFKHKLKDLKIEFGPYLLEMVELPSDLSINPGDIKKQEIFKKKLDAELQTEIAQRLRDVEKFEQEKIEKLDKIEIEIEKKSKELTQREDEIKNFEKEFCVSELPQNQEEKDKIEGQILTNIYSYSVDSWYKQYDLITDPFPGDNKGLWELAKNLVSTLNLTPDDTGGIYKELRVKTEVFEKFERNFRNIDVDLFDRTFILLGYMGCGKSVLFEEISLNATSENIFTITTTVDAAPDGDRTMLNIRKGILFSNDVSTTLEEIQETMIEDYPPTTEYDNEFVTRILKKVQRGKKYKGFLIIIDGLHLSNNIDGALQGLIQLQSLKDVIKSNGIKVSFLIAGYEGWRNIIEKKSESSGTIAVQNMYDMPEIDDSLAYEMFYSRFKLLKKNKEERITLKKDGISTIYKNLKSRPRKATFRDYINIYLPQLKQGNADIIQLSPVSNYEILLAINSTLMKDYASIYQKIELMESYHSNNEIVPRLLSVLTQIRGYLSNDNDWYVQNRNEINLLLEHGLLVPRTYKNKPVLLVIPELRQFENRIQKDYRVRLSEVLLIIFLNFIRKQEKELSELQKCQYALHYENLTTEKIFVDEFGVKTQGVIRDIYAVYRSFDNLKNGAKVIDSEKQEMINQTKNLTSDTIDLVFEVVGYSSPGQDFNKKIDEFALIFSKWLLKKGFEDFDEYKKSLFFAEDKKDYSDKRIIELQRHTLEFSENIGKFIVGFVRREGSIPLKPHNLPSSLLEGFDEIRILLEENKLRDAGGKFASLYANYWTRTLFNIFWIKYGPRYKKRLGETVRKMSIDSTQQKEIQWGYKPITETPESNIFRASGTPRTLFFKVMHGNLDGIAIPNMWQRVSSHILTLSQDKLESESRNLSPILNKCCHSETDEIYLRRNINKFRTLVEFTATIFSDLNQSYLKILSPENIKITDNTTLLYLSFEKDHFEDDKVELEPIKIQENLRQLKAVHDDICKKIQEAEFMQLQIDFLDQSTLRTLFGVDYRTIIAAIALGISNKKTRLEFRHGEYFIIPGEKWVKGT